MRGRRTEAKRGGVQGRITRSGRLSGLGMALLAAASSVMPGAVAGQEPCTETPGFERLDFWLGQWDVMADGEQVGTNVISKILDGCAVHEAWEGQGGSEGRSLFYYLPQSDEWKQVWVTSSATRTGGVKEKELVEILDDGSLRFQGQIPVGEGQLWFDRTTLTPLEDGRVRQLIQISPDGADWRTTFDAIYVPRGES